MRPPGRGRWYAAPGDNVGLIRQTPGERRGVMGSAGNVVAHYVSYAHMPEVCIYRFRPTALAFRVWKSLQGRKKPGGGTGNRHPGSSNQGAGPSGPGMTRRISRAL